MRASQLDTLKAAFDRGESLTFLESVHKYGVLALSQRVGELEKAGYPVDHEMVKLPSGKRVCRYSKLLIPYG